MEVWLTGNKLKVVTELPAERNGNAREKAAASRLESNGSDGSDHPGSAPKRVAQWPCQKQHALKTVSGVRAFAVAQPCTRDSRHRGSRRVQQLEAAPRQTHNVLAKGKLRVVQTFVERGRKQVHRAQAVIDGAIEEKAVGGRGATQIRGSPGQGSERITNSRGVPSERTRSLEKTQTSGW